MLRVGDIKTRSKILISVDKHFVNSFCSEAFPHGNKLPNTYLPVSVSGPIPREQREVELDQFLSKRSNRLGQKFNSKISQLNSQTTRDDLIFK